MITFCSLCSRWKDRFADYNGDTICRDCCGYLEICRMSTYGRIDLKVHMWRDNDDGLKFKMTSLTGNLEFESAYYTKYTQLRGNSYGYVIKYRIVFIDLHGYTWVGYVSHYGMPHTVTFKHSTQRHGISRKRKVRKKHKFKFGRKYCHLNKDGSYRIVTLLKYKPEFRFYLACTEDDMIIRVVETRLRSIKYASDGAKRKVTCRDTRQ